MAGGSNGNEETWSLPCHPMGTLRRDLNSAAGRQGSGVPRQPAARVAASGRQSLRDRVLDLKTALAQIDLLHLIDGCNVGLRQMHLVVYLIVLL